MQFSSLNIATYILTIKGCSISAKLDFSYFMWSVCFICIIWLFFRHLIAYGCPSKIPRYTFPNVPVPITFKILKSENFLSLFSTFLLGEFSWVDKLTLRLNCCRHAVACYTIFYCYFCSSINNINITKQLSFYSSL